MGTCREIELRGSAPLSPARYHDVVAYNRENGTRKKASQQGVGERQERRESNLTVYTPAGSLGGKGNAKTVVGGEGTRVADAAADELGQR